MAAADTVFSEFFLDEIGIKPQGAADTTLVTCVGSLSEEFTMKTITKSCRGRVKKSRSKPESGSITITMHAPYETLLKIYGLEEFKEGVYGYGTNSMHVPCLVTAKVLDEDDKVEYRAYPTAVATSRSISIDDDNTEVPMVEISFDITPDDSEILVYQALEEDIDSSIADAWMANFDESLVGAEGGSDGNDGDGD